MSDFMDFDKAYEELVEKKLEFKVAGKRNIVFLDSYQLVWF